MSKTGQRKKQNTAKNRTKYEKNETQVGEMLTREADSDLKFQWIIDLAHRHQVGNMDQVGGYQIGADQVGADRIGEHLSIALDIF